MLKIKNHLISIAVSPLQLAHTRIFYQISRFHTISLFLNKVNGFMSSQDSSIKTSSKFMDCASQRSQKQQECLSAGIKSSSTAFQQINSKRLWNSMCHCNRSSLMTLLPNSHSCLLKIIHDCLVFYFLLLKRSKDKNNKVINKQFNYNLIRVKKIGYF